MNLQEEFNQSQSASTNNPTSPEVGVSSEEPQAPLSLQAEFNAATEKDPTSGGSKVDIEKNTIYSGMHGGLRLGDYTDYVKDVKPLQDIVLEQAMRQPWTDQAARSVAQMAGEIVGGTIEGLGSIPELFIAAAETAKGETADFDNAIISFGRSIREGIADATPIYRTNPNATFDVLDSGWWFGHMPSVASSLSMIVPAKAVTSGLSLLSKMGRAGNLGKLGKGLSNMSAGARYATKLGLGAAVSRNAENFREAYQVYDEVFNEAQKALEDPERAEELLNSQMAADAKEFYQVDDLTPQQLSEYVASRASWRSYGVNSMNIVFDAIQFAPLLKMSKATTGVGIMGRTKKVLEAQGTWNKMSRLQKIGHRFIPGASLFGTQLTEGVEEGINYIGGEEGKYLGHTLLGGEKSMLPDRMKEYVTDGHFYEGAAWGVLGGVAHSGVAGLISKDVGPQSETSRIAAIKARQATIGAALGDIKKTLSDDTLSEKDKEANLKEVLDAALYKAAMEELKAGTVDLFLEKLDSKEFRTEVESALEGTDADVDATINDMRNKVVQAERIYKKHNGGMFYSKASQRVQSIIEVQQMNNTLAREKRQEQASDLEKQISETEQELDIDPETADIVRNYGIRQAISALDGRVKDAEVQGNKKLAGQYKAVKSKLEEMYDSSKSSLEGVSVPEQALDQYINLAILQADTAALKDQAVSIPSNENIEALEGEVQRQDKQLEKAAQEAFLKRIESFDSVNSDLKALTKHADPVIRKAAQDRMEVLKAASTQGAMQDDSKVAQDAEDARKRAVAEEQSKGAEVADDVTPPGGLDESGPANPFEADPEDFTDAPKEAAEPEDFTAGLFDENGKMKSDEELDALDESGLNDAILENLDEEGMTAEDYADQIDEEGAPFTDGLDNGEIPTQLEFDFEAQIDEEGFPETTDEVEQQVEELKSELRRKQGTLKRKNLRPSTAERLEAEIQSLNNQILELLGKEPANNKKAEAPNKEEEEHTNNHPESERLELMNKVSSLEVDLFDFGYNLVGKLFDSEGNRLPNAEITEEEATILQALYDLEVGDDLLIRPTTKTKSGYGVFNKEGVLLGEMYTQASAQKRLNIAEKKLNDAFASGDPEVVIDKERDVAREKARVQRAKKMEDIFKAGAEEIVSVVTDSTPGAVIFSGQPEFLSVVAEDSLTEHGIAYAETGKATSPLSGAVVKQDDIISGKLYMFIPGMGDTLIAVPVQMDTLDQAGLTEVFKDDIDALRSHVANTKGLELKGTPVFDEIMSRISNYLPTTGKTGVRVYQTKSGFVNLVLPLQEGRGEVEITLITNKGEVAPISNVRNVKLKNSEGTKNLPYADALDLLKTRYTDINRDLLEGEDSVEKEQYLKTLGLRSKVNLGYFETPSGKKMYVSPFSIKGQNNFGGSVQHDAVSHVVNPTLEESAKDSKSLAPVEAVKKAKKKKKSPKKKKTKNKGMSASSAMDDMLGLSLRANQDPMDDGKREDLDAAEEWWRNTFPFVPFNRVKGLINNGGELAYGLFANAAVTVSDLAIQGTAYHEGFHTAMHLYLTEEQRNAIYAEARAELGKLTGIRFQMAMQDARVSGVTSVDQMTDLQVEEYLAEKFRAFMITGESNHTPKTLIGRWFKKLKDLIKTFLDKPNHTDKLFQNIKSGEFKYQPTERMIAYAKTVKAPLALPEMSNREVRESVNIMTRLMHGALRSAEQNYKQHSLEVDDTVQDWVEQELYDYMQSLVEKGIGNPVNIQKALNAFDDTDLSEGLFSRTLKAYKARYGVDLSTATPGTLKRINNVNLKSEESDTEVSNEEAMDGMLVRNYNDNLAFHNPKDSISQEVRNTIQGLPKLVGTVREGETLTTSDNTFFGLTEFVEFDAIYPYLESQLQGIASTQEMMDRIYEFAHTADATYMGLYKKLLDAPNAENLRSAFFSHFSKQAPTILMGVYEEGSFKMLPVNRNNNEHLIRDKFLAQSEAFFETLSETLDPGIGEKNPSLLKANKNAYFKKIVAGLKKSDKLTNLEFAKRYSEALRLMGMSLVEGGVDVVSKAVARELDHKNLNREVLDSRLRDMAKAFLQNNIGDERGNLTRFGRAIRLYKAEGLQNIIQNVEGKNLYGVTQANYVSRVLDVLKTPGRENDARHMLADMLKDPRIRFSNYMRLLVKFGAKHEGKNQEVIGSADPLMENGLPVLNKEGIEKLNYALLDGLKANSKGVRFSDMSDVEFTAMAADSFMKGSTDEANAVITTPALTPSDKGTMYMMQTPRWETEMDAFHDSSEADISTVLITRALQGEFNMMLQEAKRIFGESLTTGNLEAVPGQPLQAFFDLDADGNLLTEKGKPAGKAFQSMLLKGLDRAQLTPQELQDLQRVFDLKTGLPVEGFSSGLHAVAKIIKKHLVLTEAKNLQQKIVEAANNAPDFKRQVNNQIGEDLKAKALSIALGTRTKVGMALHNYLHNYEMQVLFYGTEAEYKSDVDHGKRAASPWTPGIALDQSRFTGSSYTMVTLKDIEIASASYDEMLKNVTMSIQESEKISGKKAKEKAVKLLAPYKKINTTDAQGYMTLNRFQEIMQARGLGDKYDPLIKKIRSGKKLKPAELAYFIDPVKPFYYHRGYDSRLNRMASNLVKLSSLPLIPQLTKGTELDKLRIWMENNVDEVVYESAHKVGGYEMSSPTSQKEDGKLLFEADKISPDQIRELPHSGYTIQLDNPEHLVDAKQKFGSQLAKLILEGLNDNATYGRFGSKQELMQTYQDTVSTLVQTAHDKFMEEMGATIDEDGNFEIDAEAFGEIITNELNRRDASEVLKEGLKMRNGKFVVPAFFTGASSKVESMMLSLFTNRITNIKVPGGTAVQASSTLLESDNVRRPQAVFNEDGSLSHYEVMMPAFMKKQMTAPSGNVRNMQKILEDFPQAFELLGYRIPTEGKNSMAPMKVVGFLPSEYGGTMIVPDEFIVQMGSDFDIDKMFLQMRNLPVKQKDGTFSELSKEKKLQNDLFDMIQTILQHPSHLAEVVTPQGYAGLKTAAKEIGKLRGKSDQSLNTLFFSTQSEFRNRNAIGSSMIGIAANFNVFGALAENTGMSLGDGIAVQYPVTKELKAAYPDQVKKNAKLHTAKSPSYVTIVHKNLGFNGAGSYLNAEGVKILSELKQFIAATVDNAKDPIFDLFNGKAYTVPTILTMVMTGIPVRTALMFASQPSVVQAATKYDNNRSIFGDGSNRELNDTKKEYVKELLRALPQGQVKDIELRITAADSIEDILAKYSAQTDKSVSATLDSRLLKRGLEYVPGEDAAKNASYYVQQLAYLDKFVEVRRSAMAVQDSVNIYKADVKSAGPSTSVSHKMNYIMEAMDLEPKIFIGEVPAHQAIYPKRAEADAPSAYPILESYYENVNQRSLQMAQKFFLAETDSNRKFISELIKIFNNGRWNDDIAIKAKRLINQHALSNVPVLQDLDVAMLMGLTPSSEGYTEAQIAAGETPVATTLAIVQNRYPEMASNPFNILSRLTPLLGKTSVENNQGMKLIGFENIVDSVLDEALSQSLDEIIFSNDPLLATLGKQLLQFSFLNKGMAFQRGSYAKLFSPAALEKFNIPDLLYQEFNTQKGKEGAGVTPRMYAQMNYRDFSKDFSLSKEEWNEPASEVLREDRTFTVTEEKSDILGAYVLRTGNRSNLNSESYAADTKAAILYERTSSNEEGAVYVPIAKKGIPGKLVELGKTSDVHHNPSLQASKVTFGEIEEVATTEDKVKTLTENFASIGVDVKVELDANIKENANVQTRNGRPVITLNPNKVFGDTAIHEFGHIYVDLLGVGNPTVALGIKQLRGSTLWNEVANAYPELSGIALAKEVLVTAIGREGAQIYKEQREQKKWKIWLNKFFRAVGKIFGVEPSAARILAEEMLSNQMQRNFRGSLTEGKQMQKGEDYGDTVTEFLANKRLQLERLIRKYGKDNMQDLSDFVGAWSELKESQTLSKINDQVKKYIDSLDAYIAKNEEWLADPTQHTKEKLDAFYKTIYNYRTAISAFEDFVNLPPESGSGKEMKKIIKKLNKKGAKVAQTLRRIDALARETLAQDLGKESTNPEIVNDFMKMFNPDGMHLYDESSTELLLDSLADTNVSFIALAMKDFKTNRAMGEEEIDRKRIYWRELMAKMKADGITMESLYEFKDGTFTGKFILPTKQAKGGKLIKNPEWTSLSTKQQEYITEIKSLLEELTKETNSAFFKRGFIPAIPLDESTYWTKAKDLAKKVKDKAKEFKNANPELDDAIDGSPVIVDEAGNIVEMLHMRYMSRYSAANSELLQELPTILPIPDTATVEESRQIKAQNKEIFAKRKEIFDQIRRNSAQTFNSDLENTMEQFIQEAVNYKVRKRMENKMLLIREQLKQMEIVEDPNKIDKLKQLFSSDPSKKQTPTIKGEKSNILKHYDKWMTMVFYDHFEADENETWKKITDNLRDYSSVAGIGLNVFSAINNKTYGEMMIAVEAAASEFFDRKGWAKAKVDYNKNMLNMWVDRDSIKSDNFIVALTKRFDVLQTQDELSGREYSNPVMKKLLWAKNAVYAMQHAGEHSMQNQVLLAMLDKQQVLLNGKEVSLKDALELKNGYIEIKDGAQNLDGTDLTSRDLAKFKNKVLSVNQYLHGIYNKEDAGTLQHYALGRLVIQFRKWARPGWNKRFGSKFGKSSWNEIRETLDEGSYVTGYKFAKELTRSALNMEFNIKKEWNNLSEPQKANMRRLMSEIALMGIVGVLGMFAAGAAEDEEDSKVLATTAYMLDRSRTELMTYVPIYGWFNEGKKLMSSPIASFRQIEGISKILLHGMAYPFMGEDDKFYQGGMYRGERKMEIWLKQLLPGVSMMQRWQFIERQVGYYKLYGI